jgi:tRNA modification GTPase
METIYAVSTGIGRSAIAIVRVSGAHSGAIVRQMAGMLPVPRYATLCALRHPAHGTLLDRCLVLWFPGPASFTGEDCAEFHLHGGRAVVAAVTQALQELGCRPAEPGEFTRRAFANGKMDLTEIEGLADLIDADTELQRRQAFRLVSGGLRALVDDWRSELIGLMAQIEADIDFVEEDDAPSFARDEVLGRIGGLRAAFAKQIDESSRGRKIRDGFVVVIAGPPNAGKSTLMNSLAGRDVAIVSDSPGTTRDTLEVHLDLNGMAVVIIDTAGIRDTTDPVEQEGIRRALDRVGQADVTLWLQPMDDSTPVPNVADGYIVMTKADLASGSVAAALAVSAKTGAGIPDLLAFISERAGAQLDGAEPAFIVRDRQEQALRKALAALEIPGQRDLPVEIIAEHLRSCAHHLGTLIGTVGVEDVLDDIFSRFCIGK